MGESVNIMGSGSINLKETYNRIAEDWHKNHQQDDWWIDGVDKFISFFKPGGLVLDVGCGGGTKSGYLIEKGLRVVGIDFSEEMVEIARREVLKGDFLVCDLGEVDALDYEFDGIFIQAVLLHIPKNEIRVKLKGMIDKLKDGGFLYITVKEKKIGGPEEEVVSGNDYGYPYERFFSYFTKEEIKLYIQDVGLEIVYFEVKLSAKTNWIQVIGKKYSRGDR